MIFVLLTQYNPYTRPSALHHRHRYYFRELRVRMFQLSAFVHATVSKFNYKTD